MESTIPQTLEALVKLQTIDSKLAEIFKVRGALPEEVGDLEDELVGYQTRIQNYKNDLQELELEIVEELATSLCIVFLNAREENGNGPTLRISDLEPDTVVVFRCVRVCELPRLQVRWKYDFVAFRKANAGVEFLAQVGI